jgi:hypothetical protein
MNPLSEIRELRQAISHIQEVILPDVDESCEEYGDALRLASWLEELLAIKEARVEAEVINYQPIVSSGSEPMGIPLEPCFTLMDSSQALSCNRCGKNALVQEWDDGKNTAISYRCHYCGAKN